MPNYQNGKIYKIESFEGNCVYYGSTTQKLCVRMAEHRGKYKKGNYTGMSTKVVKYDDAKIYLVEKYPCNTKEELCAREGYYIKNFECVNTQIAGRTQQVWYEDNKERILKERKQRYEVNRDSHLIKNKQNYEKHREEYLKHNRQRYQENKEQLLNQQKQYYEKQKQYKSYCECGSLVLSRGIKKHLKTDLHKTLLSNPFINFKL